MAFTLLFIKTIGISYMIAVVKKLIALTHFMPKSRTNQIFY